MRPIMLLTAATIVCAASLATAQNLPTEEQVANAKYVGSRACRPCHMNAAQGEMFTKWEAGPHSGAYETLASQTATDLATALGIDNAQESEVCLECHSAAGAMPAERRHRRYDPAEGVGCEACHGAGQYYRKKKVMCRLTGGELEGAAVGLIEPDEAVCAGCHTAEAPEGHPERDFTFSEASEQIAHPLPAARREAAEAGCD